MGIRDRHGVVTAVRRHELAAIGKQELVSWVNRALRVDYTRIEDTSDGVAFAQLLDAVWGPEGEVPLHRLNFDPKTLHDREKNLAIVRRALHRLDADATRVGVVLPERAPRAGSVDHRGRPAQKDIARAELPRGAAGDVHRPAAPPEVRPAAAPGGVAPRGGAGRFGPPASRAMRPAPLAAPAPLGPGCSAPLPPAHSSLADWRGGAG